MVMGHTGVAPLAFPEKWNCLIGTGRINPNVAVLIKMSPGRIGTTKGVYDVVTVNVTLRPAGLWGLVESWMVGGDHITG